MRDEVETAFNFLGAFIHPSSLILHPFISSLIPHPSSLFISLLLLGACFIVVCAVVAAMSRHRKSAARPLLLKGGTGIVLEALEPEGAVLVDGELWRARVVRGGERIAAGGRVRVVGARGHWLEVEPDA
ncbi:MAG TPA: NfeD family protein [Pyrinomonadaceae bacterium]|jgi:membrane-bound ClpP family serine protease